MAFYDRFSHYIYHSVRNSYFTRTRYVRLRAQAFFSSSHLVKLFFYRYIKWAPVWSALTSIMFVFILFHSEKGYNRFKDRRNFCIFVYIPRHVVRSNAPLYKHPFGCDGMLSMFAVQKHSVPYSGPISLRKLSSV